eukprot:Opistho-1_new@83828
MSRTAHVASDANPMSAKLTQISPLLSRLRLKRTTAREPSASCLNHTSWPSSGPKRMRRPCTPSGSWSTAMTSGAVSNASVSALIARTSFPATSGAAIIAQRKKVRAVLCSRQRAHPDHQHVRVIPRARLRKLRHLRQVPPAVVEIEIEHHAEPIVLNVAGRANHVALGRTPRVRPLPRLERQQRIRKQLVRVARVNNRTPRGIECVAHRRVRHVLHLLRGRAAVELEEVHTPIGKRLRVHLLVAPAARERAAGRLATRSVQAKLHAERVNVVAESSHAGGKANGVGDKAPLVIAAVLGRVAGVGGAVGAAHPAVVNVDVDVTGVAHSVLNHRIRNLLYERLGDVACERIPAAPSHWGRQRNTVVVPMSTGRKQRDHRKKRGHAPHSHWQSQTAGPGSSGYWRSLLAPCTLR